MAHSDVLLVKTDQVCQKTGINLYDMGMRNRSDEQLMLEYAAGNVAAFEVLYERHRGPLYRFILRQTGDPATANDLYQGSWEKIIKGRRTYRKAAPFKAWMFRIARNHMVDHFRRLPAAPFQDTDDLTDTSPGPEEQLSQEQGDQNLAAAIATLPAEQKEVLMMKLEAGLDLKSIAEITGVNTDTAKSRLRYAVKKLRLLVAEPEAVAQSNGTKQWPKAIEISSESKRHE